MDIGQNKQKNKKKCRRGGVKHKQHRHQNGATTVLLTSYHHISDKKNFEEEKHQFFEPEAFEELMRDIEAEKEEEVSCLHRSGKILSYTETKKIPASVYEIWKFFDIHPECLYMDEEDIQEMEGMWFRKALLFQAREYGRPQTGMETVTYPSEQECVSRTVAILKAQTRYKDPNRVDIQDLQNNVAGLAYRKKITRQALALLKTSK